MASRFQKTETVSCPRKGPWGTDISILICDQLYSADKELCDVYQCNHAERRQEDIRILKLLQKRKNLSHKEALRLVRENRDLDIMAEVEDFEEEEASAEE